MQALIRFFVDRHLLVNVFAATLVVLGLLAAGNLQREFIPSFDAPIIWVTAALPGASARDVETKVTIPLEDALKEVAGIDEFHTVIADNSSFTTIELYNDYNAEEIAEAERDIRNAIDAITDFPPEMDDEPDVRHMNPARDTVVEVALSGPPEQLTATAEDLEERIERLDSVSNVDLAGLQDPELRVLVDPAQALAHDVTLVDIISAIERRNVSNTGGSLESANNQRQVVMWSRYEKPQDVGATILKFSSAGGAVRVRDVARIEQGREDTSLLVHNNGERGITLLVNKRETADIINAVANVRAVVADTPLPDGVTYQLINDESFIIGNRLTLMATNGIIGAILVALVLLYFVRLQPAIWILVGIPVVFLGSVAVFGRFDMSLNLMSLTAFIIVLGMVVDDAVVVSERIVFKQAHGLSRRDAAVAGTLEMMPPVTAATLTTILAFLPLVALGGLPGKIVWQIPAVVVIAMIVSAIESFFVLPAHMSTVSGNASIEKRKFVARLERGYRRALKLVLRRRTIAVLLALLAFMFIMAIIRPAVPFILFPQDDADRLFVKITTPRGTALEQTEAAAVNIERQIMDIAAVDLDAVMARIGHQNTSREKHIGEAGNEALIIVQFKRIGRQHTNAEWIQLIHSQLNTPPDVALVYQSEYFGPPTDQPVTVHVLSNDEQTRRGAAFEIAGFLKSVPGVIEVEIDERPGTPQIDLNLDYEKLALRGLDAQTVGQTLNAAFHGIEASEHRDLDDTTALRVMFDPAARNNLDALLEIPIRAPDGSLLRLRDVVKPIENPAVTRIYHRDGYRSATIRASFTPASGLTALTFGQRLQREVISRFDSTPGLYVFNGGEAAETEKTTGAMGMAAALAVTGIALVIWLMLGSFFEAMFIMLVIPFAIAGVLLTFFLHGMPLSMFAMMGAIGLTGVVVNGAIVMVDAIHRRVKAQHKNDPANVEQALIDAVVERLRPILVTTLTTLGGVLPTAYGIGGYDPMISPISLAIGWGLAFSTVVTLFLVPVLYSFARDATLGMTGLLARLETPPGHKRSD